MAETHSNIIYPVEISGLTPGTVLVTTPKNTMTLIDSTIITLAAGATYTSASWFAASDYVFVTGSCFSDVAGTLYTQFSPDSTNADVEQSIIYAAGALQGFKIDVVTPHVRLKYTNGGTIQATFRLYMFGSTS